jgi:hypothetical protein
MTMKKIKIPAIVLFVTILLFGHLGIFSKFTSNTVHTSPSHEDLFSEDSCNQSFGKVYLDLGSLAEKRGDLRNAIKCYQSALEHKEDFLHAYDALGKTLELQGKKSEALSLYFKAMSIDPNFIELRFCGSTPLKKLAHHNSTAMKNIPSWKGEDLAGKTIFVYTEKGLGDTIQFCRFLPLLAAQGAKVLIKPQGPLTSLLAHANLGAEIVAPTVDPATLQCDFHVSLLSLPHLLAATLETIPSPHGYITPDKEKVLMFKQKHFSTKKQKIGIFWQGDPSHVNDKNRSVPLTSFYAIANLDNVQLYSLQKGFGSEQLESLPSPVSIINLDNELASFEDTAAIIANLDLVISVDSAVAHLAGALGKPVWILMPKITDWRWLGFSEPETTCWYTSMVKLQQQEAGNWQEVFDRMIKQLSKK